MLSNLRGILEPAVKGNSAVGGLNVIEDTIFRTIVEEAQYREAPAIIQVSPNEFQFSERELHLYLSVHLQRSGNPFVLRYDHSKSYEGCVRTIRAGFTFVMFDGSQMEYDQNVEYTRRVVETAHGADVSVEGEIDIIEETEDYLNDTVQDMIYTSPELVRRFVENTGVDALAVSIDTIRGILPEGHVPKPQLGLPKELVAAAPVPLVLHGGSDTPYDEVVVAYRAGIYKVDISSEFKHAYYQSVRKFITNHPALVSPTRVLRDAVQEARNVAGTKTWVSGSTGKSHYYRKYQNLRGVHNVYRYRNNS